MPGCDPLHPAGCLVDVGGQVGAAAPLGAVDQLVDSFATSVEKTLQVVSTLWLSHPSPSPDSLVVTGMQQDLEWVTLLVAAVGVLVALVRLGVTANPVEGVRLARMYLVMVVVTGCAGVAVATLIQAGDAMTPWFVERAYGEGYSAGNATLLTADMFRTSGRAVGLVVGLVALVVSLAQIAVMLVRGVLIIAFMAVLPTLAADTASDSGMDRFRRVCVWIFACVVYKPVAGIIYAVGFLQIRNRSGSGLAGLDEAAASTYDLVLGTGIIVLSVLALPALVRFVTPVADRAGSPLLRSGPPPGAVPGGAVVVSGVISSASGSTSAGSTPGGAPGTSTGAIPRTAVGAARVTGATVRQADAAVRHAPGQTAPTAEDEAPRDAVAGPEGTVDHRGLGSRWGAGTSGGAVTDTASGAEEPPVDQDVPEPVREPSPVTSAALVGGPGTPTEEDVITVGEGDHREHR